MHWGIEDAKGNSTGYFYLSYYDRSISMPEVFDFNVDNTADGYIIDQYDYLPSDGTTGWLNQDGLKAANVFTAEYDEVLRAVSCETGADNTHVTYDIYLLNDGAALPDDGTLKATVTADYEHAGYHRTSLEDN